ncbi:MAG: HlyD family secretion protein [Synergistaceae bacterium]|nr:HlyD family secretion protein [Synergistaceae bacterium]
MKVSFSPAHKKNPEIKDGVRIPYAASKRGRAKLLWWSILFIVFLPFAILLGHIFAGWIFASSPGIISMEKYPVRTPENGLVVEMLVKSGSEVVAGAPVARIKRVNTPERLEQLALMKAEREVLVSSVGRKYNPVPHLSTRLVDETILYFEKEADTMRSLMNAGAATRAEVDQAEAQLRSAKAERQSIIASRVSVTVEKGTEERIAYLNKSISYLEGLAGSSFDVAAQRTGRVQSIEFSVGQNVSAGEELMWLSDPSTAQAVVYVAPEDFGNVKPGAKATVVIPGTGRRIDAEVEEMPITAQNAPNGLGDSFLSNLRSIKVCLNFKEPLLPEELVDGLPLKVNWGIRFFH